MQAANLALRFVLELAALASLAYAGWKLGGSAPVRVLLAVGAPLVAAVVWGVFISPKAAVTPPTPVWVLLQVLVFGAAVGALLLVDRPLPAVLLAALALGNGLLLALWDQ